jgi:hypothetical protein
MKFTTMLSVAISLLGIAILGGCARAPSLTDNDLIRPPVPAGYNAVSICYDSGYATRQDIILLAKQACPAGLKQLKLWGQDSFANNCPLLKKNRATFLCMTGLK